MDPDDLAGFLTMLDAKRVEIERAWKRARRERLEFRALLRAGKVPEQPAARARSTSWRKLPEPQKDEIIQALRKGVSLYKIANDHSLSRSVIRNIRDEHLGEHFQSHHRH